MAARRRITRSVRKGPRNLVWTAVLLDEQVVDNTPAVAFDIVEATDWSGAVGLERATLKRIRGWLTFTKAGTTAATGCFLAIHKADKDTGVLSVNGVQAYTDEDILWTGGIALHGGEPSVQHMLIDVKAMRRVTTGEDIRLSLQGYVANTVQFTVTGVLRALVDKGG